MAISLLAHVTFSGQLYFGRSYLEVTAFRVTTLTQQLLFLGSYFFRASACFEELLFQNIHFIAAVIFSQLLLFQSETSTEQPLLENRKFFRVVTFRNNYLFGGGIVWNKVSTEELLFRSRYFCTASTFSEELYFGKKLISQKRNIPHYTFFSGELPFQSGYFFKRRYLLQQLPFQKRYFLTTYFFRRVTISLLRFLSTATLPTYQLVIK